MPLRKEADKARARILDSLGLLAARLGIESVPVVVVNADNTVDGELRIPLDDVAQKRAHLPRVADKLRLPGGDKFWMSIGWIFPLGDIAHDNPRRDAYRTLGRMTPIMPKLRRTRYKWEQTATALAWYNAMLENNDGAEPRQIIVRVSFAPWRLDMLGNKRRDRK